MTVLRLLYVGCTLWGGNNIQGIGHDILDFCGRELITLGGEGALIDECSCQVPFCCVAEQPIVGGGQGFQEQCDVCS